LLTRKADSRSVHCLIAFTQYHTIADFSCYSEFLCWSSLAPVTLTFLFFRPMHSLRQGVVAEGHRVHTLVITPSLTNFVSTVSCGLNFISDYEFIWCYLLSNIHGNLIVYSIS
jgi:hypothetical protein